MREYWGMDKAKRERRQGWNKFRYNKRKDAIEQEYEFMRRMAGWWDWEKWRKTKSKKHNEKNQLSDGSDGPVVLHWWERLIDEHVHPHMARQSIRTAL